MDDLRRDHHRDRRGRRDARPSPGAVRQAHPAARAGRLAARANRRTGSHRTSSSTTATSRRIPGTTRPARRSSPRSTTSSAVRPSSTAPRSTGSARRTSASCSTTTESRPRGRSRTTRSSPTTPRPSSCTRSTAPAARIRPSLPRARRTRSRPSRTSRGSSSCPTTSRRPGSTHSTRPAASGSNEKNMPYSACVRCQNCDGFPCAVHGKSDAEVLGVRPALEHPNVTLLTNARSSKLETDEAGTAVTEVVVERDGGTERYAGGHRRPRLRRREHGEAAARCRRTTSTRTGSPTAPTRSGGTTCSTTARPCSRCRATRTRPIFQKTLGLNDFYFGSDDFEYPLGNIQMVGKSQAPMFRGEKPGETKLAPAVDARTRRPARGRLLALDRGPAPAREPGDGRPRRQAHAELHGDERRIEEAAHEKLRSMLGRLRMEPDHLFHRFAYM